MDGLVLYIANKNYSSWSFPSVDCMKAAGILFEEVLTQFDDTGGNPKFREFSPTGRVPVLKHGSLHIWESLAIIEYVAELYPEAGVWPYDPAGSGTGALHFNGNAFRLPGASRCLPP